MATLITKTIKSAGGDYSSRSAFEAGEQGDLVTADQIKRGEIYAFLDTTKVVIDGSTTDAARYMELVVAAGEGHVGKWDDTKARLIDTGGWGNVLSIEDPYCRVIGDQLYKNNSNGSYSCIQLYADYAEARNCIAKGTGSSTAIGITFYGYIGMRARNCICYDCITAISFEWQTDARAYNCTVKDSTYGFLKPTGTGSGTVYLKNCLADNCASGGFVQQAGTFDANYCASSDATADDFGGIGNRVSQTFIFVDAANDNFHLASSDAGAKDYGTDLSGDANYPFSDDIDGQTRSGTWDIGADEYIAAGGGANWLKQGYWWEMYRGGR